MQMIGAGKAHCGWDQATHGDWSVRRNTPGSIPRLLADLINLT